MKNKILISFLIFIALFLTISSISASEDINDGTIGVLDDNSPSLVSQEDVSDDSQLLVSSNSEDNSPVAISKSDGEISQDSENLQSDESENEDDNDNDDEDDEDNNQSSSNQSTVNPNATSLKFIDKKVTYTIYSDKDLFQLQLLDGLNQSVSGKKVTLTVCGKNYTAKTNADGYANFYLSNLKKGTQTVKFSFLKSGSYLSCSGTTNIVVKSKLLKDSGYWIKLEQMFKTNFKKLSKNGIKHVFILSRSIKIFGKKKVLKWIKDAHKYNIKVHLWMPTFSDSQKNRFYPPAFKSGAYNYKRINLLLKKVKYYSRLKGVDGIHFDYLRYLGNAYKYKKGVKAINYLVKKSAKIIHKNNRKIIFSAAVMPEPNGMKRYYGQDISTLSKHLDVIIPMSYKGNYHASSKWIKKTTQKFVQMSKGAQIWVGLQSYKSDKNPKKLSVKALKKDVLNAKEGGASGVILFRLGLSSNLNFISE